MLIKRSKPRRLIKQGKTIQDKRLRRLIKQNKTRRLITKQAKKVDKTKQEG
jgi:hypothetical protein